MKRMLSVLLIVAFLTAPCIVASAESTDLSVKYVPRSQRGALFYLDVYIDQPVSAALFELHYDPVFAEFRDARCEDDDADAMGNAVDGTVRIAYSHRSAASGRLYRLSFKALRTGTTRFSLHPVQAADRDLNDLTGLSDCSVEVKFGKDDVVASGAAARQKSAESSEKTAKSAEKSSKTKKTSSDTHASDAIESDGEEDETQATGGKDIDYSGGNSKLWFVLGCATALFVVLAAGAGFVLGRKLRKKPKTAENDSDPDGSDSVEASSEPDSKSPPE